jgi:heavy metal sensor kinase
MNRRSIRVRLTAGYALVLMATCALAGGGAWLAMRGIIHNIVDDGLRARVALLQDELVEVVGEVGVAHLSEGVAKEEALVLTTEFRISDGDRWIYQSPGTENWGASPAEPDRIPAAGVTRTLVVAGHPVRLLTTPLSVRGARWVIELGSPVDEFYNALNRVASTIVLASPFAMLLVFAGGYWMSGRALAPVDRITRTARTIGVQDLAARLPLRGSDDELDRLSVTLNEMFARLEAAFERVTQFTADASHELRTPVAIIRTTAELARRTSRTEAEYVAAFDLILAESVRTSRLIDDLLLLARGDAGADGMVSEPMDLVDSLREACEEGRILAEAAAVSFSYDLPSGCPVAGDPSALQRLFLVLLDNAVKYTPAGGGVRVTVNVDEEYVEVDVRDTGVGIPPEDLPHLFERFYRVSKDRSRRTGGAGLGLSIAQWIARHHQGDIFVESQPGCGSVFRVRLPIVPFGRYEAPPSSILQNPTLRSSG